MDKMGEVIDLVEKVDIKGAKIVPLFITVDPERDDVNAVNKYLKGFTLLLFGNVMYYDIVKQACHFSRLFA